MMNKYKIFLLALFSCLAFSSLAKAECHIGSVGGVTNCEIRNNSDGVADAEGRYPEGGLREMIRTACLFPGDDDLTWNNSSSLNRTIVLSTAAGSLSIPASCDGAVRIQGPTGSDAVPVILDASALGDTDSCAIKISKNKSGIRNIEIRGGRNVICANGNDLTISQNKIVRYTGTAVTFNSTNSQYVGNSVGVYSDRLADASNGLGQIGFFGIGTGNEFRENFIKYNRNAGLALMGGSGNRFVSNIIAQNNNGIDLVEGSNGGIEPPVVASACAERSSTPETCRTWNVSVTGRANARVEIYMADTCWPDSNDASCLANSGRGQGEGQKILARNIILSTADPLAGCVSLPSGKVKCTTTIADPELTPSSKITAIQTTELGSSEFGINVGMHQNPFEIPEIGFNIECLLRGTCGSPIPSMPTARCGDGIINQDSEMCDGETGCSSTCQALPTYTCNRLPADSRGEVHAMCIRNTLPVCGDGVVNRDDEMCDGEPGCSTECQPLSGWTCRPNSADTSGQVHSTCTEIPVDLCGNGVCDPTETAATCSRDCMPTAGCNLNGICDMGETSMTCAHDCPSTPACNRNGRCDAGETVEACASDCMVIPGCNRNGICDGSETVTTCASDCEGTGPSCNRNGRCDAGENNTTCALDCPIIPSCNNNGVCEAAMGETESTCFRDCGISNPPVTLNPPTGLSAQAEDDQVTITFTDNATNEEGYRVSRANGSCGPDTGTGVRPDSDFATVGTIPSANPNNTGVIQWVDTVGIQPETVYCYRVTTYLGPNSSSPAKVQVVTPPTTVINPPIDPGQMQGGSCSLAQTNSAANSGLMMMSLALLSAMYWVRRRVNG